MRNVIIGLVGMFSAATVANAVGIQWNGSDLKGMSGPRTPAAAEEIVSPHQRVQGTFAADSSSGMLQSAHRSVEHNERTLILRGVGMDFKKSKDPVSLYVLNNTMDMPKELAWVRVENVVPVSGRVQAVRATGMNHFYVRGSNYVVMDIQIVVPANTRAEDLLVQFDKAYSSQ